MDIPIVGTIDFSPSGLFLFFAAVIALGYFGYQLFGVGRAGRDAKVADETPQVEAGDGAADNADGMADNADGMADNADGMADNADGMADNADGMADNADGMADNADAAADKDEQTKD